MPTTAARHGAAAAGGRGGVEGALHLTSDGHLDERELMNDDHAIHAIMATPKEAFVCAEGVQIPCIFSMTTPKDCL